MSCRDTYRAILGCNLHDAALFVDIFDGDVLADRRSVRRFARSPDAYGLPAFLSDEVALHGLSAAHNSLAVS